MFVYQMFDWIWKWYKGIEDDKEEDKKPVTTGGCPMSKVADAKASECPVASKKVDSSTEASESDVKVKN